MLKNRPEAGRVRPRFLRPAALLEVGGRNYRVPNDYSLVIDNYVGTGENVSQLQALLPHLGWYICLDEFSHNSISPESVGQALNRALEKTIELCKFSGRLWLPNNVIAGKSNMFPYEVMKRGDYILTLDRLSY